LQASNLFEDWTFLSILYANNTGSYLLELSEDVQGPFFEPWCVLPLQISYIIQLQTTHVCLHIW